ncbi:hypothetical protein Cgig2_024309 [Carnegiea gigantea]|uniref:Uncharacterized protein n=1 Tax=Carnegiea gigantea TaxID=171969 RepID=A0A9Q1GWA5_9CARY|nr:hypothetical protein Cgig2_024309 [Carnegiea gigantea]
MTFGPKHHNVQKYYEFHEQNGYTTAECRELRKALHELADKGQINCFLKRGITRSAWNAQLRGAQQVLTAKQGTQVMVPTIVFDGRDTSHFTSSYNDPLVIEMKVASEVNPTGMFRLPLYFGEKGNAKNLEVDFLVVDISTAYNIILGRPTLHKVKAIIAPYLLQLQFKADDGSVGTIQGDQCIA